MYIEVLYITVAVCVSAVVLGGLMYVVLVGGCWLANRKNKRRKRKMTNDLLSRLESDDLKVGLDALAEVVYQFSEWHGGCYVTSCRCAGHNSGSATADRLDNGKYTSGWYDAAKSDEGAER